MMHILKNNINFLFLLFIFSTYSSNHKENEENILSYSEFPQEKELRGEIRELDKAISHYPFRIRIDEDKAIIMVLHGYDSYGHLFQYPSSQYLFSFGKDIARQNGRLLDGEKYIYIFSLKGEPLYKYVLNHYVYGIWVDEVTKTIITTNANCVQSIVKV